MLSDNIIDVDERTNAVGLFNTARSYWHSAEYLDPAQLSITHPSAPVTFLLCHAIELYLKAYLRSVGSSVAHLKRLGHHMAVLAKTAIDSGLKLKPEHLEILSHIDDLNVVLEARYIVTGFKSQPTSEALSNVAGKLDQAVCAALTKRGHPVRATKIARQMRREHTLNLEDGQRHLTVYRRSKTIWIAEGDCMGNQLEAKGATEGTALVVWLDAARRATISAT